MAVMIGIDPHKGSHTAVALDDLPTRLTGRWVTRLSSCAPFWRDRGRVGGEPSRGSGRAWSSPYGGVRAWHGDVSVRSQWVDGRVRRVLATVKGATRGRGDGTRD